MTKKKKYTMLTVIVMAIAMLVFACGTFMAKHFRTHALSANEMVAQIEERLQSDPNYIVTDLLVVQAIEPNYFDLGTLIDYRDPGLQVTVRNLSRRSIPRWRIQFEKLFKRLLGRRPLGRMSRASGLNTTVQPNRTTGL